MSRPERFSAAKQALRIALEELLERDMNLLISRAHEQAICHRLAVYLDSLTDLNVDCEYNRNMMKAKQLSGGRRFRPDIIIHRRLSNAENVLVVETKSRAQNSASDERKLSELTAEMSTYRYWAGAFIVFFNQPSTVMQSGVLQVTIDWFSRSEKEERIQIAYPIPSQLICRVRDIFSS
jgi:hypothetical protein